MSVIQAVLLGLAGTLVGTSLTGGQWNQIAIKPLIISFVCGLIMGDMKAALDIGIVLQSMYLGVVNVGGVSSMPTINICAWFIIPVCIATGQGADIAIVLATAFGSVETVARTLQMQLQLVNVHWADSFIEKGNVKMAFWAELSGYAWRILFYFIPIVICNLAGQELVVRLASMMPVWLTDILAIFVKFCPLVGFSLLLITLVKNEILWLFVLLGFMLFKVLGMSILSVTIVGCVITYIVFVCTGKESE